MTNLPHTIYIKGFTTYDILTNRIPSRPLAVERRAVTIRDGECLLQVAENGVNQTTITTEFLTALIVMNDLTYTVMQDGPLPENDLIEFDSSENCFTFQYFSLCISDIHNLALMVNELYTSYVKTMYADSIHIKQIRLISSRYYGENFEFVLPGNVDKLTQSNYDKVVFDKLLKSYTTSFRTLGDLRAMTSFLVSDSLMRTQPSIILIKNSTVTDFTASKYRHLISNSVFQVESNMDYSSPIQYCEHLATSDMIRSLITPHSSRYLKLVFGEAFTSDYINSKDPCHLINFMSATRSAEIVAFASERNSMTQVYLPVQKIVMDRKLNSVILTTYFEAFAHIALINNKNTGKPVNLILKYPANASREEFSDIMLPMLAVLKNRAVTVIFYETDESVLEHSPFHYEVSE